MVLQKSHHRRGTFQEPQQKTIPKGKESPMKKLWKMLVTIGGAILAATGAVLLYRKFFAEKEEAEEAFDDEAFFDDGEEETEAEPEVSKVSEEIFEEEHVDLSEDTIPADETEKI